ncbi:hypothetical protein UY3_16792 [Chelonia mydas]|uniref:Uncharacterized protein n=1 Tax=Chelonia mydas TaxID=8469 RepID=M7B208_CHEMY|nr:hypothetical protein UY3_16792 [Chelonia mydas]
MAMTKKLMVKIRMATEREPAIAVESRTVATRVYDGDGASDGNKDCSGAEEGGDEGDNGGQDGIDMGGEEPMTGITRKLMTVVEPRMATRPKPAVMREPMMVAEPGTTATIRESVMATEPRMEATRKVNELMMVAVKRSVDGADSKANGTQDDGDQEADDACDCGIAQDSDEDDGRALGSTKEGDGAGKGPDSNGADDSDEVNDGGRDDSEDGDGAEDVNGGADVSDGGEDGEKDGNRDEDNAQVKECTGEQEEKSKYISGADCNGKDCDGARTHSVYPTHGLVSVASEVHECSGKSISSPGGKCCLAFVKRGLATYLVVLLSLAAL